MDELQVKMMTDFALCNADVYGHLLYGKYGLNKEQIDTIMNFTKNRYTEYINNMVKDFNDELVKKLQNPPL